MDAGEAIQSAEERIGETRSADAGLTFLDADGNPLAKLQARVKLRAHGFKLGANAFRVNAIDDAPLEAAYEARFAGLLNYATLPFYWGSYENARDRPGVDRLAAVARWCAANAVTPKGHPLVWHEVFPAWAASLDDTDVLRRLEARVRETVSEFAGLIDIWDVFNEATVSDRSDNAVGRWVAGGGAAECVAAALRWAHEAAPRAMLLYNDFNVSPDFEALLEALQRLEAPFHAIGVQSHMHKGARPLEWVWNTCESYARFGLPLHFTEVTILSGRPKAPDDNDWHAVHTDWPTTAAGEEAQLEYGRQFYTLLFSHPAVEAVTWWDFSDDRSWQGAPSGLLRKDMTPKPLYDWLVDAFCPAGRWSTDERVTADENGRAGARCFFGDYEVAGRTPSGDRLRGSFRLSRAGAREVEVMMA